MLPRVGGASRTRSFQARQTAATRILVLVSKRLKMWAKTMASGICGFSTTALELEICTFSGLLRRSGFVFHLMGNCFSSKIKAETPLHAATGLDSGEVNGDKNVGTSLATPRSEGEILKSPNLKVFSFSELRNATGNFRPDSVLGEGGFGSVFKGWVDENSLAAAKIGTGMAIAVKRLNQDGFQGHREWLAEVNLLGQFCHPNLVKLVGYCSENEQRLLVYEFMPRGSLENHLFRRGSYFQPLSWNLRMKIALDAARGLEFLHSNEAKVIYRDFKTSNVLLDSNYNAKLSDFGLAKDGPTGDKSHVSTRVMGTYGYADPEYITTGHLTTKSDVYSFGVVLLEMISGRRAVDENRSHGEHNLVEWAKPYLGHKRRIFSLMDNRLEGKYSLSGAQKIAVLAVQCLSPESRYRPTMNDVVTALEQIQLSKDMSRTTQNEKNGNAHHLKDYGRSNGNTGQRSRKSSEEEISKVTYTRPSASPLYV